MIEFHAVGWIDKKYNAILFDEEGREKMKLVLSRALNTLSPPDPELISLYDALEGL